MKSCVVCQGDGSLDTCMCQENRPPDTQIKPVSCRVASFLDNKTDRIIYEEAVCEINRIRTQPQKDGTDASLLEEAVLKLEEAVRKAHSSSLYYTEREMNQVKAALASVSREPSP